MSCAERDPVRLLTTDCCPLTESTRANKIEHSVTAETKGLILVAEDQSLFTQNYQGNVLQNDSDLGADFAIYLMKQ